MSKCITSGANIPQYERLKNGQLGRLGKVRVLVLSGDDPQILFITKSFGKYIFQVSSKQAKQIARKLQESVQ